MSSQGPSDSHRRMEMQVLSNLWTLGSATETDLASFGGLPDSQIRSALARWNEQGIAAVDHSGAWGLTDQGARYFPPSPNEGIGHWRAYALAGFSFGRHFGAFSVLNARLTADGRTGAFAAPLKKLSCPACWTVLSGDIVMDFDDCPNCGHGLAPETIEEPFRCRDCAWVSEGLPEREGHTSLSRDGMVGGECNGPVRYGPYLPATVAWRPGEALVALMDPDADKAQRVIDALPIHTKTSAPIRIAVMVNEADSALSAQEVKSLVRQASGAALVDGVPLMSVPEGARQDVVEWYDRKTEYWLEKYGPGPVVHYHTGLVDPATPDTGDEAELKTLLVASQQRMLDRACEIWGGEKTLSGHLVDIGCGLGGTAIHLARRYGARVTAVSPVARHLEIVRGFAREAGVEQLVRPELGASESIPGAARFDAAYAIDASCYFDREKWFARLATLLRPGGNVFIIDTFTDRPECAAPFDRYWLSKIGSVDEYREAAARSGFDLVAAEDVTAQAAGFWRLTVAYSKTILGVAGLTAEKAQERRASIEWLSSFYRGHLDRQYFTFVLGFMKRPHSR